MYVLRRRTVESPKSARTERFRLLIIGVASVVMLLVSVPAIAHDYGGNGYEYSSPSNCTSGRLCVYSGHAWNGGYAQFSGSNTDWSCCSSAEDNDESAYNNGTSGRTVTVYSLPGYTGDVQYCLWLGHGIKFLANVGHGHANNGDSNRWLWNDC